MAHPTFDACPRGGTSLPATPGASTTHRAWYKDQWTSNRYPCDWCREHPPRLWAYAIEDVHGHANYWHGNLWYCGLECWGASLRASAPGPAKAVPPASPPDTAGSVLWELVQWGGLVYIVTRLFGG